MKICAVIAEYNPFHLGHKKQLDAIRADLKADKIIVIMSGNFTQRGSAAILDKFTRARHAIYGGADIVLELPTVFATANAQTFAMGAIKLLRDTKTDCTLVFGAESGEKSDFISAAEITANESVEVKSGIKKLLKKGYSLISAKAETVYETHGEKTSNLLSSPNNILGVEYVKAIKAFNADIDFVPLEREGNHSDEVLKKGITSASSIRNALLFGKLRAVKKCVPNFVYGDLKYCNFPLDSITLSAAISANKEHLATLPDCGEGLENRIRSLVTGAYTIEDAVNKISTKRYTKARIRRILTANLLGIDQDFVNKALKADGYAKVLAVRKEETELVKIISEGNAVPLMRKSDVKKLSNSAKAVFMKDVLANDLYNLNMGAHKNEYYTEIVEI